MTEFKTVADSARDVGFVRGLAVAAYLAIDDGKPELAKRFREIMTSSDTMALANMDSTAAVEAIKKAGRVW